MDERVDTLPEGGEDSKRLEMYLHPGEELLISSGRIGIKKFLFTACLTNRRLFLIDQKETRTGVTAKEIPIEYIVERYLDLSPGMDPVLVLSVRTSDDDLRTMKLRFIQSGIDRVPEGEQWMVMFRGKKSTGEGTSGNNIPVPAVTKERPAAPTMVWPGEPDTPPLSRGETVILAAPVPREEKSTAREAAVPEPRAIEEPERRREPDIKPPAPAYEPVPVTRSPPLASTGNGKAEVLYCYHCGKKIPPMANFCPYCGTPTHDPGKVKNNSNGNTGTRGKATLQEATPAEKPKKQSFWKRLRGKE